MKRSRFSEERIIGILKEHQAGIEAKDLCRKHGISAGAFYRSRPSTEQSKPINENFSGEQVMEHGPMGCRLCWRNSEKDQKFCDNEQSKVVNDPGYWGAPAPRVLILGMSKGNTQSDAMSKSWKNGDYDYIPYMGFRPRLLNVLQAVGLLPDVENLDSRIKKTEQTYGWASILRCSLTGRKPDGSYGASSAQVIPAMRRQEVNGWLTECIASHIGGLSRRTQLVVLLGNDDRYMRVVGKAMKDVFGRESEEHPALSPVVFRAGPRFFVHVGHPSPLNGTFREFLEGDKNAGQGKKREMARLGVAGALGKLSGRI